MEHALPILITFISFWASVAYGFQQQWLPAVYWFSAFTLNIAVIGMTIQGVK